MEWLNYHHLLYFWIVAREGTIARASEELRLGPADASADRSAMLEEQLGEKLFQRSGRNLVLTEVGPRRLSLCRRDLRARARVDGHPEGSAHWTAAFGSRSASPTKCTEDHRLPPAASRRCGCRRSVQIVLPRRRRPIGCSAELAMHAPRPGASPTRRSSPAIKVKAFSHRAGRDAGYRVRHAPQLAAHVPEGLSAVRSHGAPFLMPTDGQDAPPRARSVVRSARASGRASSLKCDDSALLNTFGQAGAGLFVAPTGASKKKSTRQYGVTAVRPARRGEASATSRSRSSAG